MTPFAQEVPTLNVDEVMKTSARYDGGIYVLCLVIVVIFICLVVWWFTSGRHAAKKRADREDALFAEERERRLAEDRRREAETRSRVAMGEVLVALGQQAQQINTGVARSLATGEELRAAAGTERRAWRIVGEVLDTIADSYPDADVKASLKAQAARLHEVMDDDSRVMRALTDADVEADRLRRQQHP